MAVMDDFLAPFGARWMRGTTDPYGKVEWGLVAAGSAACAAVCVWVAGAFGVPAMPGFNGSLLAGLSPVKAAIAVIVGTAAAAIPATAAGVVVGVEGGAFCLAVGVAALAAKCGSVRSTYQYAGNGALMTMAFETVIFAAVMLGGWQAVARASAWLRRKSDVPSVDETDDSASPWAGLAIQVAVTAAVLMIVAQNDGAKQAIGGLAVATIAGVAAANLSGDPVSPQWYWFATPVLGVIGYALALVQGDRRPTGDLAGWGAALARPTPLEYAAVGLAAGIFGWWVARRWAATENPPQTAADLAPAPPTPPGV